MALADLDYREESYSKDNFESPLKDGMIGRFIVTEVTYPYLYLKRLKEENEKKRQEAEYLQEDYVEIQPDPRYGGIAIRCCLLEYDAEDTKTKATVKTVMFDEDKEEWTQNKKFNIFTEVDMLPIDQIFDRTTVDGKKYGDVYRLGGDNTFGEDNVPRTYNMFPTVRTAKDLIERRSEQRPISENEIKKIKENFENRSIIWKAMMDSWKDLTDKEVVRFLQNRLSRRLMFYDPEIIEGKVQYYDVQPGIIFQAKIRKREDSNYFRLVVLEWDKSNGKWFVNNYGKPIIKPMPKTALQAKNLSELDYNK